MDISVLQFSIICLQKW